MPRTSTGPKKPHTIHFPIHVADQIQALATKEDRSFNQIAVRLASEALKTREQSPSNGEQTGSA